MIASADFQRARTEDPARVLAAVLDALPLSLYVVDRRLRVVAWNRYRETGPLGRPRSEVLGRSLEEVLSSEGFAAVLPSLLRVFETGVTLEETTETRQGERTFRTWRLPVLVGSRVTHVVSLFEDVTERLLLEEQLRLAQSLEAMKRLAAAIARDVSGALAAVGAHAERLLSDPESGERAREHAQAILDEMGHAAGIPRELLAFSEGRTSQPIGANGTDSPRVEEAAPPAGPGRDALAGGTETILLAEDQDAVRALARKILEKWGYRVLEAAHGLEALEIARTHEGPIHLLLTDLGMPYMRGDDLARSVARLRPETRMLVVSAHSDEPAVQQAALAAGAEFMSKPFTLGSLARTVRRVLDKPAEAASA